MLDIPPEKEMAQSCKKGDWRRVRELLEWGVKPETRIGPMSYLSVACEQGHLEVVKLLMDAGAHVSQPDLIRAIRSGNVPLAERLLDHLHFAGEEWDFWTSERPLLTEIEFLRSTNPAMIKWMLDNKADPSEQDRFGGDGFTTAERDGVPPEVAALILARR